MINVTESAWEGLTSYFGDKEVRPIRIQLANNGCKDQRLLLALDDKCSGDRQVTFESFTFLINERLAEATGNVYIDKTQFGFSIDSEKPLCNEDLLPRGNRDCAN